MRPLQRFRKCSTLCHEGRRLKIGYPRIVAPLYGISAEKDDFVMGVLAIFHGGNLEIMEQTTGIQPMFGKKQSFHGVTTAHLAIRRSKPMNRRLSHRPGGQRGIPRVCCEIRMRLYLKMGYTMVYGYTVYPKKTFMFMGRI